MTPTNALNKTIDRHPTRQTATRRLLTRLASFGLALAALLLAASPASAATVSAQTANHGSYALSQTTGGVDLYYQAFLNTGGTSVWRSPAYAGTQRVTVEYKIWRFTSPTTGWVNETINGAPSLSQSVDVAPGYYAVFPSRYLQLDPVGVANYSIQWTIRWKYTNGAEFASVNIGFINAGDYACANTRCMLGNVGNVAAISLIP
jgi:hypothetical protein